MELLTREIILKVWKRAMEHLFGQMEVAMMVNSNKIILKDLVIINGLMEDNMKDNGGTIKWMEKGYLFGQMVENMKVVM